jgi:hypothetical protein
MSNSWSLIVVGAAVVLLLFVLSLSGKKPPLIPEDAVHADLRTNEACLPCHAPGKSSPLKENHPPKEQCVVCHKARKG